MEFCMTTIPAPRPIRAIASEIHRLWQKPKFSATPYIVAMSHLNTISDRYFSDSAESIILYFLSNATTWRGEDAKRIKLELKAMLPKR